MTPYEIALLVATALFVCILLWDNHRLRDRLERSEADITWLKRAMHNTVRVHQTALDRHTQRLDEHDESLGKAERGINRLEEQTGKISARAEQFRQNQPDFTRLNAQVERLMKAESYRRQGPWNHEENKFEYPPETGNRTVF